MIVVADNPALDTEELRQGWTEVTGRQAMQVQQWQHLGHLRGFARPRRQDRRGKPLPLTSIGVKTLVVDPRRGGPRQAPAAVSTSRGLVMAVAHHQSATVVIDLVSVGVDVGGNLGLQGRGQHLPGTVADNLIQQ